MKYLNWCTYSYEAAFTLGPRCTSAKNGDQDEADGKHPEPRHHGGVQFFHLISESKNTKLTAEADCYIT